MGFSKKSFADESMSDHKLLYHVVQAWENSPRKYQFCNEYNLSNSTMEVISGIKQQIITQLRNTGMLRDFKTTNENSGNWNVIRSALGMYLQNPDSGFFFWILESGFFRLSDFLNTTFLKFTCTVGQI